jgi:hypothetical protein
MVVGRTTPGRTLRPLRDGAHNRVFDEETIVGWAALGYAFRPLRDWACSRVFVC